MKGLILMKKITSFFKKANALRFVFLELGRFNKQISDLETPFEKWIYLLKHMHNMKGIPSEFDEPLFKRFFLLAEISVQFTDLTLQEVQSLQ